MFGTLLVSVSGQNKKMVEAAKKLRIAGVNLMSITKNRENTLAHLCDFNLYVDESNHFETPMHWQYESTTAYFILIDILFLKYLEYHQRKEADHEA
ncbi:SIS domain-containing protein [Candidatus Merdisoma sp. JLR.KK011]